MNYIDSFNINKTDYDASYLKNVGVNEVTSLSNLPINKRMIHATLSEASTLSIQDGMETGEGLIVICECAAEFKLQFNSDSEYKFIGETGISKPILCQNETMFKIYITKSSDSSYVINLSRTFKEMPRDFILVSTDSGGGATLLKYTNIDGSSTESISIPAGSTNYKVGGLIYGFRKSDGRYITSLDLSNWDASKVTDMSSMLAGCIRLTSLDLSNFNTSKVTDMSSMFTSCSNLTSLDLSNFNTSKVTDMSSMFSYCSNLTSLDLSNWDTSNVTSMSGMFNSCSSLTSLDLSSFDIGKVVSAGQMQYIFNGCSKLISLNLSNFDISNMSHYDAAGAFEGCISLNHIKCKQAFKDWCWKDLDAMEQINLPSAMRSGGSGTWEIVP